MMRLYVFAEGMTLQVEIMMRFRVKIVMKLQVVIVIWLQVAIMMTLQVECMMRLLFLHCDGVVDFSVMMRLQVLVS